MIGLEFICKLQNIEFKEVAERIGISPQSVSDWIKGRRKIPLKRAKQLSQIFDISPDLFGKELGEEERMEIHYKLNGAAILEKVVGLKHEERGERMKVEQLKIEFDSEKEETKMFTTGELEKSIKTERRKVKINEADIMISQLQEMYRNRKAIDVHPEFQRVFRWTDLQKSRFIESILLGIPIPPIFVAEDEDLNWDVIDGVQRLSTIFEFLGILLDDEGILVEPTVLVETPTLKGLGGKVWNNKYHQHKFSFEESTYLTNAFLNATLKVIKVDSESDPNAKYDIFDRLNTGGSNLSDQEIRNCLAIMLNREFYIWLRHLSYQSDFRACLPISVEAVKKQDDLEFVLRFIVYRNIKRSDYSLSDDITRLLTDTMKSYCIDRNLDYEKEQEIFEKTFELLNKSLGEDTFKTYYPKEGRFKGALTVSAFEIIAIGVAENLPYILDLENPIEYINQKVKDLYSDAEYINLKNAKISSQKAVTRFTTLTEFGKKYFSK